MRRLTTTSMLRLGTAAACAWISAAPASGQATELDRLLAEMRAGHVPRAEILDEVVAATPPETVGRFTGSLRRSLGRADGHDDAARALLELLLGYPERTLERIAQGLEPAASVPRRVDVGFAILLADGDPWSIDTATSLAGARLGAVGDPREARRLLQAVLEAALVRDERESRRPLERSFVAALSGLEAAFADALRAVGTPRRLEMLTGLLRLRPGADGMLLNRVQGLALRLGPVLADGELRTVRSFLDSEVAFERVGAAQCAGALEDRDALYQLVTLLRDEDASVRNAAHDALRSISAMTMGPAPERWAGWLDREDTWWRERGSRELARLPSAEGVEALRILREAAHHRLFRDEIAGATLPLLSASDPNVVRMGVATLEAVRARGVELEIVELLEHPSKLVRKQAFDCLRHLTGRALPNDALAWRRALSP